MRHNSENETTKFLQNKNKKQKTITKAGGLVMKTKNNVQQAILKSLAVVFSLVLISITVDAQDFWKSIYENNGIKEIALAMVDVKTETTSELHDANSFSAFLEVESEEALEIENWMMNENNFGTFISIEEEIESPLEVENWMTDENSFNPSNFELIQETDNQLEIEDWMLNENLFGEISDIEEPLELEDWMLSEEVWNN